MKSNYLLEIHIYNMGGIIFLVTGYKLYHLGNPIGKYVTESLPLYVLSKVTAKSMLTSSQPQRNGQWGIKALVKLALGFMANRASGNNIVNILSRFGPKEVLPEDMQGLVQAKVASKGFSMGFPNQ